MPEDRRIANLSLDQLSTVLEWAQAEGWNPGLHDAQAFFAADPWGFFGLFVDGQLTASASVVRYDDSFAFGGCYICRPQRRGEGLGSQVAAEALGHAGGATIGLDGVLEREGTYRRMGFVSAQRNVRYGGRPRQIPAASGGVVTLGRHHVDQVVDYERRAQVFEAPRRAFLEHWLSGPDAVALGVGDDQLCGYGVIRRCHLGSKIGPLFAAGPTEAHRLCAALVHRADPGPVFLDVPASNPAAIALAVELGLEPTFETVRMYRGPRPPLAIERIFGITSFELG